MEKVMVRVQGESPSSIKCPTCGVDISVPSASSTRPINRQDLECSNGHLINYMSRK